MKRLSTDLQIANAKAVAGRRTDYPIGDARGLWLRVSPNGGKSWSLVRRVKGGKPIRRGLGEYPAVSLAEARKAASRAAGQLRAGEVPPTADQLALARAREAERQAANTVGALASLFIDKHVKAPRAPNDPRPRLRSWKEVERIFQFYVLPAWKARTVTSIKRRDVSELLDVIESNNGPVMADRVLAWVRKMFNWHATRDDDFVSPIVKGMARTKPKARARKRMLDDREIRALWKATAATKPPAFGSLVRALLLTAQRREEVAKMRLREIDGIRWTVPDERHKTGDIEGAKLVPLPKQVQDIIAAQPTWRGGDYVFTTTGDAPFSGFSKCKAQLDVDMRAALREIDGQAELQPWVLHDLRRTARSLMSRAGVPAEHAERVLGHVIPGVAGVYDRHAYADEKRAALFKLEALVQSIVAPTSGRDDGVAVA
jgi:integrase